MRTWCANVRTCERCPRTWVPGLWTWTANVRTWLANFDFWLIQMPPVRRVVTKNIEKYSFSTKIHFVFRRWSSGKFPKDSYPLSSATAWQTLITGNRESAEIKHGIVDFLYQPKLPSLSKSIPPASLRLPQPILPPTPTSTPTAAKEHQASRLPREIHFHVLTDDLDLRNFPMNIRQSR